jgi:hypothetical protein
VIDTAVVLIERINASLGRLHRTKNHRYQLDGEYLPGVTSIIGVLNKPFLLTWAGKMALQYGMADAHQKVKEEAGAKGTDLHAAIEAECRIMMGEDVQPICPTTDEGLLAMSRWRQWVTDVNFEPIMAECFVFHEGIRYAGQIDFIARVRGRLVVGDWKTGGTRLYAEAHLQNAAYRAAIEHMTGIQLGGHLVHVPRDGGVITDCPAVESIDSSMRAFSGLLEAYKWQKEIEKALRVA